MARTLHHADTPRGSARRAVARALAFGTLLAVCGCASGPNLEKAEESVKVALEKWKEGGSPKQLLSQDIDIADPDWKAGYRLLDYQMKSTTAQPQQGPRVVVVLKLQDSGGKKVSKE